MQKIIFINRFFYPDISATSQMLSDLAFGLASQMDDKEIHIVTSRQRYDNPVANLAEYEERDGVHIHRIKTSKFGRQNLLGRAVDYLSFYLSAAVKLFFLTKKQDILVAKTDPPMISIIAAVVANIRGAKLVNWLQDLFPEVAAELGIKLVRGAVYRLIKTIRNKTLFQANMNIVIGRLMAERLRREGVDEKQIIVIHNWADEKQIHPISREENPLRKDWGLTDQIVFGYSGNLGRSHDFDAILAGIDTYKNNSKIAFLFIGGGAQLPEIKQYCHDKGLHNVLFKPYQSREKLAESLSVADVHLVSLKPELEGLIVPSKFYGILAVGRPVIFFGDSGGELAQIINQHKCGRVVEPRDNDQFNAAIEYYVREPNMKNKNNSIRTIFSDLYSYNRAQASFLKILVRND